MSKVVIIGAGGVGGVVTHKCAQLPDVFTDIVLASRTKSKCDAIAAQLSIPIRTAQIDADNVPELTAFLKQEQPKLVINVALPYQDLTIMDACLAAGVNYMDTANYEPRDTAKFEYKWQWEIMRLRGAFASMDIHNNTGINPHYSCVRRLDHRFFHLATLFSRTVVYFKKPDGVQVEAFADICPAVTVECGLPGQPYGVDHAFDYLRACLNLAEIPTHPLAQQDINLFHTVAIVKVPQNVSIGVDNDDYDIRLIDDIDHLNFRELPVDTTLGWVKPGSGARLEVWDETGREVGQRFLRVENDEIRTAVPVMPSMFTLNVRAIRQDCLGYLMEAKKEFFDVALNKAEETLE